MSGFMGPTGLEVTVRQLQVVTASLAVGCLVFLFIAAAVLGGLPGDWLGEATVTPVSIVVTIGILFARLIVPWILLVRGRSKIVESTAGSGPRSPVGQHRGPEADSQIKQQWKEQLLALFRTRTIVGQALLEGAAFFLIVAAMVDKAALPLVVAVLVVAGMLVAFPTVGRTQEWLVEQQAALEAERSLRG